MNLFLIAVLAFYGVAFDPATTNAPSASQIAPVNFVAYRMVQPDGAVRVLCRDSSRPGVLLGERPWLGTVRENVIRVWADPAATGGKLRTLFVFIDGQLRELVLDGVKYTFPAGRPKLAGTLESLWPEKKSRSYRKGSSADIWRYDGRLKLWFANPNSAGLLCAQVALLGLWLLLGGRWFRRLPGLALLSVALWGVAQSGSRGALLALVVGATPLLAFALRRRLSLKTLALAILAIGVAVGAVAASGMAKRFSGTLDHIDDGNLRRLAIGKAAIRMFADAPCGWHCGEVPGRNAALNFYVFDDNHVIRTHLLTMAECGWFAGFGYAFFWVLMMTFGFSCAKREESLSLGEWAAFAAAGLFNPVYTELTLWALPVLSTLWCGVRVCSRLSRRALVICIGAAALIACVIVIGLLSAGLILNADRRTNVRASGRAAVINGRNPSVWIVEDQPVLGGWGFPGREILAYCSSHTDVPTVGYVWDIRDLPREVEKLVLPGRVAAEYLAAYRADSRSVCHARKTVLLSPSVTPDVMDERLLASSKTIWLGGALAAARDDEYCTRDENWMAVLPGVNLYVPNWLKIIFAW